MVIAVVLSPLLLSKLVIILFSDYCPASLSTVLDKTDDKFDVIEVKVTKLEEDAYEAVQNATKTKERAEELLKSIKDFMDEFNGSCNIFNTWCSWICFSFDLKIEWQQ